MTYEDERMALYEQQRAEMRRADYDASQLGLVGMSLLPAVFMVGLLCATLRLILEQQIEAHRNRVEAKCLEEAILDATERAQTGQIIPMERILGVSERG